MEYTVPKFKRFSEVVQHYRDFLEGKIPQCPTHGAPLDPESADILSQLLQINSARVVSVDSQPGIVSENCSQRAYLDCYMRESTYNKLFGALAGTEFIIIAEPYVSSHEILYQIPVTFYGDDITSSIPVGSCFDMDFILENCSSRRSKNILKKVWHIYIIDPIWGRPTDLFDAIASALK